MARLVIVELTSARRVRGRLRVLDGGAAREGKFAGAEDVAGLLNGPGDAPALVGGVSADAASVAAFRAAWPGDPAALWHAADLAYLLGLPDAEGLDGLAALAESIQQGLEKIEDDLLAQICLLVREQAAEGRLGLFVAELFRRHDALRMPAAGKVDMDRYYPLPREEGTASRQEVPVDILERVFEAQGALAQAFDDYEDRPQQLQMALAVAEALADSRPLVVEAGTGIGKSLAYLLPLAIHAAHSGSLCLVSTNTLNLQAQLIELDIPRLRQVLDTLELKITLLKGREHYLCLKRLQETWLGANPYQRQRLRRGSPLGVPDLLFIIRLLLQFPDDCHGDLDAVPGAPRLRHGDRRALAHSVDCSYQTCLGERCEYKTQCHFFRRRAEALSSHLVIANHALVFALFDPADSDADNVATRASVVVFDEAHNLEGAITNQNTLEVTHQMPVELGNRLLAVLQHDGIRKRLSLDPAAADEAWAEALAQAQALVPEVPRWIKLGVEIRDQVNQLLQQAAEKGHLSFTEASQLTTPTASTGQRQVLGLLSKLAARLHGVLERMRQLAGSLQSMFGAEDSSMYVDDDVLQMDLQSLVMDLVDCTAALSNWRPEDPEAITWFNCALAPAEPAWEYKTAPLRVGPLFQALLAGKDCTVLCGATLTVAGRFDYLQESLGFAPEVVGFARWLRLDSPFDHERQSLLLIATDMAGPTGPSRDEYLEQLEAVVAGVCQTFARGVLVLFNSYRDLNHIAERLAFHVDQERILVQGVTGSRAGLSERFRREGDKVLLGTRSFWEGFDVAGDALSCVVLAKLPFANYRDPIHAGRQRAIDVEGGDSFLRYSLPLAAMQLKQGFGRLIRSTQDHGCVFLLDSRVARANYGKVFLDSLPGPRVIAGGVGECLEAAREFMAGHGGGGKGHRPSPGREREG